MNMKALAGLISLLLATNAFAQSAQPKVAAKPSSMHAKLQAPAGCKLVGTVKGTKLWAGDCMDAAALRGAEPTTETTQPSLPAEAGAAIPPGQKQ
jgi:hypothetical protein